MVATVAPFWSTIVSGMPCLFSMAMGPGRGKRAWPGEKRMPSTTKVFGGVVSGRTSSPSRTTTTSGTASVSGASTRPLGRRTFAGVRIDFARAASTGHSVAASSSGATTTLPRTDDCFSAAAG